MATKNARFPVGPLAMPVGYQRPGNGPQSCDLESLVSHFKAHTGFKIKGDLGELCTHFYSIQDFQPLQLVLVAKIQHYI